MMTLRIYLYLGYYLLNLIFVKDPLAIWTTAPLMMLILYDVAHIRSRYVFIDDMIIFIFYLFFVIEPVQQIDHGHLRPDGPVGSVIYRNGDIIAASMAVLLFYIVYRTLATYLMKLRKPTRDIVMPIAAMPILVVLAVVAWVIYVSLSGGLSNLLQARYDQVADEVSVLRTAPAGLLMTSTILLATFVRPRLDGRLAMFLGPFLLLLLTFNPFNSARFFLIAAFVPIGFIFIRGKISASIFYAGASFGILVVMPLLSLTTRFGSVAEAYQRGARDAKGGGLFDLPFLDVFDLFVECVRYTAVHGHSWGAKLLVDFTFYIPRSIWTGKPTLNALDIGNDLFASHLAGTANLSMFVAGDGYRDFGFFGVALAAALVALLLHLLLYQRPRMINGAAVLQYMVLASVPILIRGPVAAIMPIFLMQWLWFAILVRALDWNVARQPVVLLLPASPVGMPTATAAR